MTAYIPSSTTTSAAGVVRDLTRRQPKARRLIAMRGWGVAVFVYVLAVFHRSSLGVAGLQAEHRFGIGPGQLSVFVMLQLGVYAAMQIPTGILVDRFGPRRLLVAAALLMGVAQLAFALVPTFLMALLARGLLGCGDALTFVSVLRFASVHFAPRRFPIVVAATGMLGALGNVVSTVPLSLALQNLGWAPTFTAAGCVSLATGAVVWFLLPVTGPAPHTDMNLAAMRAKSRRVGARVQLAWTRPGTRLGFWLHFSTMSATTSFGVLWGLPYLVSGLGFTATQASETLLLGVVVIVTVSPLVGLLTGRHPAARVPLAIGVCLANVAGWVTVLSLPPDRVPHAVVVVLVGVMAVGGPASSAAFALARDYNRPEIVGTASGVVNVGGFTAVIVTSLLMGLILDFAGSDAGGYRLAMVSMVAVQVVGAVQLVRWWRVARAFVLVRQRDGDAVPVRVHAHSWDLPLDTAVAPDRGPDRAHDQAEDRAPDRIAAPTR